VGQNKRSPGAGVLEGLANRSLTSGFGSWLRARFSGPAVHVRHTAGHCGRSLADRVEDIEALHTVGSHGCEQRGGPSRIRQQTGV